MAHKEALKVLRKRLRKIGEKTNLMIKLKLLCVENEKNASTPELKAYHAALGTRFLEQEEKLRARSLELAHSVNALEDAQDKEKEGK